LVYFCFKKNVKLYLFDQLGRDTPSSQVTENEDIVNGPPTPSARINPSAKQCKFDLDDKFGKFEIKSKMQGKDIHIFNKNLNTFQLFFIMIFIFY